VAPYPVRAVRAAVPGDQVRQCELVYPVVVLRLDPVGIGLPVLAQQDQRGRGARLGGERQVEQDERIGIPMPRERDQVDPGPGHHGRGLHDDEPPGPEHPGTRSANHSPRVRRPWRRWLTGYW
jgi:hypothetical protein